MNEFRVVLKYHLNNLPYYFFNKTIVFTKLDFEEYERRLKQAYKDGFKCGSCLYFFEKLENIKKNHFIE